MNCTETRALLSSYLDGAVTGKEMLRAREHLTGCSGCSHEFALLKQTQLLVTGLGRRPVPPQLQLQIRVAVSQQLAKARRPAWQGMVDRFENLTHAMMPATAGLLSAVVFFCLLIGLFAIPSQLEASGNDVPTMLYTPPVLKFSPFEVGLATINADSVVVEAYIDTEGRVQDYRILSAPSDSSTYRSQLNNLLILTVFRPATSFGQPTTGKAVLSFSKINVKG